MWGGGGRGDYTKRYTVSTTMTLGPISLGGVCVCVEGGRGERGGLYLTLHCHHNSVSCIIKMGSDESHFNV